MNCYSCHEATRIISIYGSFFECSAIKKMSIKEKPGYHAAHQVMSYDGQLFIPNFCPNVEVTDTKEEYCLAKNQKTVIKTYWIFPNQIPDDTPTHRHLNNKGSKKASADVFFDPLLLRLVCHHF